MKVTQPPQGVFGLYRVGFTPREDERRSGKVATQVDGLSLSPHAKEILALREQLRTQAPDPARQARVAELQRQVQAGLYQVDGRLVAEKMLHLEELR